MRTKRKILRQPARHGSQRWRLPRLIALWAVMLLAGFFRVPAHAYVDITEYRSFAGNIQFQMTGASMRQEPDRADGGDPCLVTTSRPAQLSGIPGGAQIQHAFLYWAGSGATPDGDVVFAGENIAADLVFTTTAVGMPYFSGFADITSRGLVTGNGVYTLSGLSVDSGSPYCDSSAVLSGWSLIVIYSHSAEPLRVINLYHGFREFWGSGFNLTPSNFLIPSTGCGASGDCRWGVLTWEGDAGNSIDRNGVSEDLFVNGNAMSTTLNPLGNQFNSTIDLMGTSPPPPYDFSYGVDIDIYPLVNNEVGANDTSATTTYQSGQDLVLLSAEVFAVVNTPVADLSITKSHAGQFTVGQEESYTIRVHNNGPNDATGTTTVTDTLPTGLTYVSHAGSGWNCAVSGQDVTCDHGTATDTLASNTWLPDLRLSVNVDAAALPSVTNTVIVSNLTFDNRPGNNTASDNATVYDNGAASGTKLLYFYLRNASVPDTDTLQRVVNTSSTSTGIIPTNSSYTALLSPVTQDALTLRAGTHTVSLIMRRRNDSGTGRGSGNRDATVTLDYDAGGTIVTLGSATRNNILSNRRWQVVTFDINLAADVTLPVNSALRFTLTHEAGSSQTIEARSLISNGYLNARSQIALDAATVINVDSVTAYTDQDFPQGDIQTSYAPGADIRIRAVVRDPFGHDDITSATITILDPGGSPDVSDAAMTEVDPLSPGSPGAFKTFEYRYQIPAGPTGGWTAVVTANEGTEGTISHSNIGGFVVGTPSITMIKSVRTISNPFESGPTAKAIPGAILEYEIIVTNSGIGPTDSDSLIIGDLLSPELRLVLGDPTIAPVSFTAGTSGLDLNPQDVGNDDAPLDYNDVALSSDGGNNFLPLSAISQSGGIDTTDPKIDYIRINPKNSFSGTGGVGAATTFTLRFRVQVE